MLKVGTDKAKPVREAARIIKVTVVQDLIVFTLVFFYSPACPSLPV